MSAVRLAPRATVLLLAGALALGACREAAVTAPVDQARFKRGESTTPGGSNSCNTQQNKSKAPNEWNQCTPPQQPWSFTFTNVAGAPVGTSVFYTAACSSVAQNGIYPGTKYEVCSDPAQYPWAWTFFGFVLDPAATWNVRIVTNPGYDVTLNGAPCTIAYAGAQNEWVCTVTSADAQVQLVSSTP